MRSPRPTNRMPNCKAYNKPSCWLPRLPTGELCATCNAAKCRDEFREFTSKILEKSDGEIYEFYQIHKKFLSSPTHSPLDTFLHSVWLRSPTMCERIVRDIKTGPVNPVLLLRVRNHARTSLCQVYSWALRKGLFDDLILPDRCLTCLAHTVRYGCDEKNRTIGRMITWRTGELPALLRNTRQMLEGEARLLDFQNALIERGYPPRMLDMFVSLSGRQMPDHPLRFQWNPQLRRTLENRVAPWREEFVAKSWHPSRMQHWCLDLDDQTVWGDDFPQPEPLRCARAHWDIRWG
jgi:hypothetical protein